VYQIVWLDQTPPAARPLQTLGFPGASNNGGEDGALLHFAGTIPAPPRKQPLWYPQLMPSVYPGYRWIDRFLRPVETIPSECDQLTLTLYLWNAAQQPAPVKVRVRVLTGTTLVLAESIFGETVLPAAVLDNTVRKTGVTVTGSVPAAEFRRIDLGSEDGRLPLTVEATLLDEDGHFLDGWQMSAIALSLTPVLDSLGPCLGKVGDTISVYGIGFGQTKPASAGVWFNGAFATEYVAWSDRSIRVKVPPGATSGDVVLATRPEPAYRTKGKPFTVVEKLPYPRITALSGTYKPSTFYFEHTVRWTGGTPPFTVTWIAGDVLLDQQTTFEYRRTVSFTAGQISDGYQPGDGYYVEVILRDALGEQPRVYGDVTSFLVIWDLDTMLTSITVPGGFPYPEPTCP
jgi:hypothetical protein